MEKVGLERIREETVCFYEFAFWGIGELGSGAGR